MTTLKKFWICLNCNSEVEEQFEVCWNCQHDRSGALPSAFSGLDLDDRAERAALSEKWRDKHCAECNKVLTYLGRKQVREGSELGILGDLVEAFPTYTDLHVYGCSACGRTEYFT